MPGARGGALTQEASRQSAPATTSLLTVFFTRELKIGWMLQTSPDF
jgi:hypothetical protein